MGTQAPADPPPVFLPFLSWGERLLCHLWAQGQMKMQVLCLTAEHEAKHGGRHGDTLGILWPNMH